MYQKQVLGEKQNIIVILQSIIKFIRDFEKFCAMNNIHFADTRDFSNKIGGIFKVINFVETESTKNTKAKPLEPFSNER
jgi:hypothetical protein